MSTRGRREDDSPRTPYGAVAARPDPPYEILVDGHRIPAVPGQTVGAAMAAAGFRSWRTTRYGDRPRGLFCGIGVCFDCLVTVNGRPSVRACLVEAQQGDTVETQAGSGVGTWVGSARSRGGSPWPGVITTTWRSSAPGRPDLLQPCRPQKRDSGWR